MDKGGWIQYQLKEGLKTGYTDVTHIQLPAYTTMARHLSSGWTEGDTFHNKSRILLETAYEKYSDNWKSDYDRVASE